MSREELAADPSCEREVLLKDRLKAGMLRLKEWMTGEQAPRVIFDLKHMDALGVAGNQAVHECLIYGMNVAVDFARGPDTRTARFCDFDHPEGGLNDAAGEGATGRPHMATCYGLPRGLGNPRRGSRQYFMTASIARSIVAKPPTHFSLRKAVLRSIG